MEPVTWVLGLAASGEAAARLLRAKGAAVWVLDRADSEALRRRAETLRALGIRVDLGRAELPDGLPTRCVVSPGVPESSPWIRTLRARGVPVVSELEVGWSHARCRVLAVTGSNGKSTLVKLCAESLARAGLKTAIAGNYGPPVSAVVGERRPLDWLVLEVSSFQLETVDAFRPDVGIVLNVLPNHLDRHGGFEAYERLKARLFARMTAADTAIAPDTILSRLRHLSGAACRWRSFGAEPSADWRWQPGEARAREGRSVALAGTPFDNPVLGAAAAAAAAALEACGVEPAAVGEAAAVFQRLPHRLQEIGVWRGVRFVNDSKATNLAALMAALRMTRAPIRLIAGGLPKHEAYEPACPLLTERVAAVYLIGQATDQMAAAWGATTPCRPCGDLATAVRTAWAEARPGDTILLSPACASFDQFKCFEERGERFAEYARAAAADAGA